MFSHTKIVCTIGPSVASFEKMVELIDAGMNVARLNFSHGTHEDHLTNITLLKKAREYRKVPLAIMLDTHGPKIRVGKFKEGSIALKAGEQLLLGKDIPIFPEEVIDAVSVGINLLFDDGYIVSKVIKKGKEGVWIEVLNAGILKSGKGVNIPGIEVPLPALTEKDIDDLKFGAKHDVDVVAGSFIRSKEHVYAIREVLEKEGKSDILIIAKIESTQGIDQFDSILDAADGIMVARGDLGVEVDLALVPKLQKMMIKKACIACKPVVTATQMLESMIVNPRPTRAEVSDVANAIYDSTSCIMLSAETAAGKYPIETVERMKSIALQTEIDFNYRGFFDFNLINSGMDVSSAVSIAAVKTAYSIQAKCIFAYTTSGQTARHVSRLRPEMPIIAVTSQEKVYHQLSLHWGVVPVLLEGCDSAKAAYEKATDVAISKGFISKNDLVVVTSGIPFGKKGTTNMMMVETI